MTWKSGLRLNDGATAELSAIVLEAVGHVLPSCGIAPDHDEQPPSIRHSEPRVVAHIALAGEELRGGLELVIPLAVARAAYPLRYQREPSDHDLLDWTGEIANRLIAHIKRHLTRRAMVLHVSTPRAIIASYIKTAAPSRANVFTGSFTVGNHVLSVSFDATSPSGDLALRPELPETGLGEGDVLLFD